MNSVKKVNRIVPILLVAFSLMACGKTQSGKTILKDVTWTSRKETVSGKEYDCKFTEVDGIRFVFNGKNFEEEKAEELLNNLMQVITYADSVFPKEKAKGTVCLGFKTGEQQIPVDEPLSAESIFSVVESVHSVNCGEQYGLFYLYGVKEGILEKADIDNTELKKSFDKKENMYLLDFCSPMVETVYMTEEEARLCRMAVTSFATWYEENHSFEEYEALCRDIEKTEKEQLVSIKNEWLKSLGCKEKYEEFCKIFFTPATYEKDRTIGKYEIKAEDVIWLWDNLDVKKDGYKAMVSNYKVIEPLRVKDFAEAREFLKEYLPEDLKKPYIITKFVKTENGKGQGGWGAMCYWTRNCIELFLDWDTALYALDHEYVHHLTVGEGKLLPITNLHFAEPLAVWIAEIELPNYMRTECWLKNEKKEWFQKEKLWNEEKDCVDGKYNQYYGAAWCYNEGIVTSDMDWSEIDNDKRDYPLRGCLAKYVYETYGMKKLIAWAQSDGDTEDVLGISFKQLQEDMVKWVENEFNSHMEN